jgi:hypothetical protein
MCARIHHRWGGILVIAVGISTACGSLPAGLREALGEFETGATQPAQCAGDYKVGGRKEVSRFQILPVIWQQYSHSNDCHDPQSAWNVANRILSDREQDFRQATNREWDYVDIYVMWNAPGQYRRANWDRSKLSSAVRQRAQRFANLMEERARSYAVQNARRN